MMPSAAFCTTAEETFPLVRLHPASKIAGLGLTLLSFLIVPGELLPPLLLLLVFTLWRSGLEPGALAGSVRPWLPVSLLVLVVHILTTVEAAPLGTPTWQGLWRGLAALARVAGAAGSLALFLRVTPLGDLTTGLTWWWRPWHRFGLDSTRLSLVLAVALGTVPSVVAEGRRIDATVRLRRGGTPAGHAPRRWWRRMLDTGHVVVPLIESLFRRAEGLTLSLQNRLPRPAAGQRRPPLWQFIVLTIWTGLIVVAVGYNYARG